MGIKYFGSFLKAKNILFLFSILLKQLTEGSSNFKQLALFSMETNILW